MGTHAELLAQPDGLYRRLCERQFGDPSPPGRRRRVARDRSALPGEVHHPQGRSSRQPGMQRRNGKGQDFDRRDQVRTSRRRARLPRSVGSRPGSCRPYRWWIALGLVGLLAQSLLVLPIPLLQGRVVDSLVPLVERPRHRGPAESAAAARVIARRAGRAVACLLARLALAWWVAAMMGRISQEVVVALRAALHGKFMRLPMSYFDAQQTGKLMARVTERRRLDPRLPQRAASCNWSTT